MPIIKELDYIYAKLQKQASEKINKTIEISDEEYNELLPIINQETQIDESITDWEIYPSFENKFWGYPKSTTLYIYDNIDNVKIINNGYYNTFSSLCYLDNYCHDNFMLVSKSSKKIINILQPQNIITYSLNRYDFFEIISDDEYPFNYYVQIIESKKDDFLSYLENNNEYILNVYVKYYNKTYLLYTYNFLNEISPDDTNALIFTNYNANDNSLQPELSRLEFPKIKNDVNNIIVIHKTNDSYDLDGINYSLEWDCDKKAPRWVCYQMHSGNAVTGRTDAWGEDPDIPSNARFSDTNSMYKGSGFVRGHLVAPADRLYSVAANRQTFYYSNMLPMFYNFNAGDNYTGVWAHMEDQVRSWIKKCDTLYVVKGGTIDKENQILMRINPDVEGGLIVPKYFFMALLAKTGNSYKALGFWAEHNNTVIENLDLRNYVVTIDELEALTGIDFFCNLPDNIEKILESKSRETIINEWFGSNDEVIPEEGE